MLLFIFCFTDGTEGTDLEYESPFVFPNGFVDQNGIYYVNSKYFIFFPKAFQRHLTVLR